jgi:pimeloyl-ACP methyl ester carboxylesterase
MGQVQVGGRIVEWSVDGPDGGVDVVFFHGTPGGMRLGGVARQALLDCGARIISFGRPGYGRSTRLQGRRVVDVVEDLRAVLVEVGVAEFRAFGWSGGGPHALAAACVDGCVGVTVVASVAPPESPGWYDGMAADNVVEFKAAAAGESALRELVDPVAPALAQLTGEHLLDGMGELLAEADREALGHGDERDVLAASIREALSTGNDGHVDDDLALVTAWGFEVRALRGPVTIWHGEEDRLVPVGHGRRLAELIDHAVLRLSRNDGHISILLSNAQDLARSVTS